LRIRPRTSRGAKVEKIPVALERNLHDDVTSARREAFQAGFQVGDPRVESPWEPQSSGLARLPRPTSAAGSSSQPCSMILHSAIKTGLFK
jgi:hypothetical protein